MGAVIFDIGPPATLYCTQLVGLTPASGATPRLLVMVGKWTRSPAPWQDASGLTVQCALPGESSQGIPLAPSVIYFPLRQLHWCVSVPALLSFIQCRYLWALDSTVF